MRWPTTTEENDRTRKDLGHSFPNASLSGSYCRHCGCSTSFAPNSSDPDFQPCPGKRPGEIDSCQATVTLAAGYVSPALNDALTGILATQGIEVFTQAETEFIEVWARKHHPRRKYLTDAQFAQARAEYAATKGTP